MKTAAATTTVLVLLVGFGLWGAAQQPNTSCTAEDDAVPTGMSESGRAAIPARFITLYRGAARRSSLGADGWLWLAAIHKVETDQNRNVAESSAGAQGPMQFMPATWVSYGVDGDGDGRKDVQNTADAIYGAANYLHASGAPKDWHRAIFAYNHAEWYYQDVLGYQSRWAGDRPAAGESLGPQTALAALPAGQPGRGGGGEEAARIAAGRQGVVAYALADRSGTILTARHGNRAFLSASLSKAMLLVAALRADRNGVSAAVKPTLEAMITRSDNTAANRIFARVGAAGVKAVAAAARMTHFRIDTADPVYRLGDAKITANDQARFFARIDELMPARARAYGMQLLSSIVAAQRWGIWDAGFPQPLFSKAGWKPGPEGYIVNQAAQVRRDEQIVGIAVMSVGPSWDYGKQTIKLLSAAIAGGTATETAPADGSACADPNSTDITGPVPLTPGQRARLLPNGQAAAPQNAPPQVQAMIAAGNRIVGKRYSQSPPHGTPYTTVLDHYDCSSSIAFILFHAGLIKTATENWVSGTFASSFGLAGPGQWVTLEANAGHIYMYIAGLRWDTHRYGGADRGDPGIGWHTAVRPDGAAFTTKHPGGGL